MSKKQKTSKKQPAKALFTVSDQGKIWTVPEDEEMSSQPLHEQDASKAVIQKGNSPLEATFTTLHCKNLNSAEDEDHSGEPHSGNGPQAEKPVKAKKATNYTALEFFTSSSQTNSVDPEADSKEVDLQVIAEDESIITAGIALLLELFKPLWSLAVGYWYYKSGNETPAYIMTIVLFLSGFCTHFVYFVSRTSPIRKIWKTSKTISLLCAIPFALPIILAASNCIFSIKEAQSRMYERPWTNSLTIFMVESLTLAFPQCVLQVCLLMEHIVDFPSVTGFALLLGTAILSIDVTFTRIRHDAHKRYDRFGDKWERSLRFAYIWANKVIWICTYAIVIVSLRVCYPDPHQVPIATAIAAAGIFLIHEVVVIVAILPMFRRIAQSMIGLFFIFPQFIALSALLLWVNTDKTIYETNVGSLFLGIYFWGECAILVGWLMDRGIGKEPDFLPVYPHFTGDAFLYCCQ